MFNKILIANRGEIACRIARSAHDLGIRSVAVYSDADRDALHVKACDEAAHIGGLTPAESYLDGLKIIQAALKMEAEAIHPGFGFLSENAQFAEDCKLAGLVFIGPSPDSIRDMGSKSTARQIMEEAKVPVVPGYDGDEQAEDFLLEQANEVGYPVLIKAVSGGGGKGLRVVSEHREFSDALQAVKREGQAAFGDDKVLLERYLPDARHIEIQIFADSHGNVIHLYERDCSLQRRHQKVVEEAPAPGIDDILRADMYKAAIRCARATHYLGAGTIEFLLSRDKSFYFIEMNTRLQVEHPVTEMVTGRDLVAWQIRIAAGEALPADQRSIRLQGHAFEARIYAENPEQNFLPSTGKLRYLKVPAQSAYIRIDSGVEQGDEISPFYDPMIAKLISYGRNRAQALARLRLALDEFQLIGPRNNIHFLSRLCAHPEVESGGVSTLFIDSNLDSLVGRKSRLNENALLVATVFEYRKQLSRDRDANLNSTDPHSPWAADDGWRIAATQPLRLSLLHLDETIDLNIKPAGSGLSITALDKGYQVEALADGEYEIRLLINDSMVRAVVVEDGSEIKVLIGNRLSSFTRLEQGFSSDSHELHKDSIHSPMPGKVIACPVSVGQEISQGETLMVIEAMKMEHTIQAPHDGQVEEIFFKVGDQVEDGDRLLAFLD